jgi:hypothetical protein
MAMALCALYNVKVSFQNSSLIRRHQELKNERDLCRATSVPILGLSVNRIVQKTTSLRQRRDVEDLHAF